MKLAELIAGMPVRAVTGDPQVEITGISYDSRETRPGHLFFSMARDAVRNRANIDDALNRGARAVVVDGGGRKWGDDARLAVSMVDAERPRLLMGAGRLRMIDNEGHLHAAYVTTRMWSY